MTVLGEGVQPSWGDLLAQVEATGSELAKPEYTIDQIFEGTESIAVGHPRHDFLVQSALWAVTLTRAWNRDVPIEDALAVAVRMKMDHTLGNSLADVGKYLDREEGMHERAVAVLGVTATVFANAWDDARERGTLTEELLEDFERIAGLQDEVGDRTGAQLTARAVIPRLLDYEAAGGLADADDHFLDCSKEMLLAHLDSPEDPLHAMLYDSLRTPNARERVNHSLAGDRAIELVKAGQVNEGFALARTEGAEVNFTLDFYSYLSALVVEQENHEQASAVLDKSSQR